MTLSGDRVNFNGVGYSIYFMNSGEVHVTVTVTGTDLSEIVNGEVVRHIGLRSDMDNPIYDQVFEVNSDYTYAADGSLIGSISVMTYSGRSFTLVYSNDGGNTWVDTGYGVVLFEE